MRHRANMLAPPPSPEMAESPAYRALPASAKALLLLIEVEVAEQGGLLAAMTADDLVAATGMRRSDLIAALTELSTAGFVVTATIAGIICIIAPSTGWRRS